jgi:hypothetical protein
VINGVADGSGQLYNTVLHRVFGGGLCINGVLYTTSCITQSTGASFICIESRIEDFLSQHYWGVHVIMFHYDNEVQDASIRHAAQASFHSSDLLSPPESPYHDEALISLGIELTPHRSTVAPPNPVI